MIIKKIISGGQTGVDQAVLQAAIDSGIKHGGWCPPGRVCETGTIPEKYQLIQTPLDQDPAAPTIPRSQRTIWNVRDADGILIFMESRLQSDKGTMLAIETAERLQKPMLVIPLFNEIDVSPIKKWIQINGIRTLSVGGPSESNRPGAYDITYQVLIDILR